MSDHGIQGLSITSIEELENIKKDCQSTIKRYAMASAATSVLPLPGIDIAADLTVIYKMFSVIKENYGLDMVNPSTLEHYGALAPLVRSVFNFVTKDGIMKLVAHYAPKYIGKKYAAKYVPIIGQGVAAVAGYKLATFLGKKYSDDCYKLCVKILKNQSH